MKFRSILGSAILLTMLLATAASAQATRTWVSGVGDDANPCSRTAPCKTFAGAISKTAPNGEISVLDPGGFGAVTITKGMTLDGVGTLASILASGVQGVVVNAGVNDVITLRDILINGTGGISTGGLSGVRVFQAKAVNIEHCEIWGFTGSPGRGVNVTLGAGSSRLNIIDTYIHDNSGTGVAIAPSAGAPPVKGLISNSRIYGNGAAASGVFAGSGANLAIVQSNIEQNGFGVDVDGTGNVVNIDLSNVSNNGTGLHTGNTGKIRASRSFFTNNTTAGFNITAGSIETTGDNRFAGNGADTGALTNVAATVVK